MWRTGATFVVDADHDAPAVDLKLNCAEAAPAHSGPHRPFHRFVPIGLPTRVISRVMLASDANAESARRAVPGLVAGPAALGHLAENFILVSPRRSVGAIVTSPF
jgi:hypothetical protein